MPTIHYEPAHAPREREDVRPRYHSTTYVRDGVEAARVAMELERAWRASLPVPAEREPEKETP